MKIFPVGAEFYRADRQMDRHYETNSRFSQILRTRLKSLIFVHTTCFHDPHISKYSDNFSKQH